MKCFSPEESMRQSVERVIEDSKICQGPGYFFGANFTPEFANESVVIVIRDGIDSTGRVLCQLLPRAGGMGLVHFRVPIRFYRGLYVSGIGIPNLLAYSEDMEQSDWDFTSSGGGSVDSPTQVTLGASPGARITQDVVTVDSADYTLFLTGKSASANKLVRFRHSGSDTGDTTDFALTAASKDYAVSVLGKSGAGVVAFGVQNRNSTLKVCVITRWSVVPGIFAVDEVRYHKTLATASVGNEKVIVRYVLDRQNKRMP